MKKAWYLAGVALFALIAYVSGGKALLPSAAYAKTTAGPNVVNVVAREYQFEMPDSLPAGPTLFHFTDDGTQLHHMTLVKLGQGKTLADFTALPPGPPPAWAVFMGGPNTPMPKGGQDEDVVDLSPGNYAVICLIPDADGKPHMMKGMVKALTVTPSTQVIIGVRSQLLLNISKNYALTPIQPPIQRTPSFDQVPIRSFWKGESSSLSIAHGMVISLSIFAMLRLYCLTFVFPVQS